MQEANGSEDNDPEDFLNGEDAGNQRQSSEARESTSTKFAREAIGSAKLLNEDEIDEQSEAPGANEEQAQEPQVERPEPAASEEQPARSESKEQPEQKSETTLQVLRSKGTPRPAKVALLVWRISGNFASRVLATLQEHTPTYACWQNRKRRLLQETLLVRIVKQVVEWEQYAEASLAWKEPYMQQSEGKLQYVQGSWALLPGRICTVADATAAMVQAVGKGGVNGSINDFVLKYIETFHKRLAIRGYSAMESANVCLLRSNLQREFFAQGSIQRRFQTETKVLANELGKRRAENNKFDSYANTIALKEKFFRVQLRQSQLTAEANLASRSLYTFRQLAKLYRSVKDVFEEYLEKEREAMKEKQSTAARFKRSASKARMAEGEDWEGGFFEPGAFRSMGSPLRGPKSPASTGPGAAGGAGEQREGAGEYRHSTRPSFAPDDMIALDDAEGHSSRIEDLQVRRDELKVAAASMAAKSRFNQLVKLMDQGHEKLQQLVVQCKHNDEIIEGVKEAIEEEMLPAARKWVQEMAVQGKLPRDMMEKVQTDSLQKAGVTERDALARKVARMDEMVEELAAESRRERALRRELEELGGPLPPSAPELAKQAAEAAKEAYEANRPSVLNRASVVTGPSGRIRAEVDGLYEIRESKTSFSFRGRQSPTPQGRAVGRGRGTSAMEVANLTIAQKLVKVQAMMADAQNIHGELLQLWPLHASVEGDRLLERAAAMETISKAVGKSVVKIMTQEAFEVFEERSRKWQTAGERLLQNMESFTDTLEFEQMPDVVVKQALHEQAERARTGQSGRLSSKQRKVPTQAKRAKMLQKLQEAQVKIDTQINSYTEKNGRQHHTNEELTKLVYEAQRDLAKAGVHVELDDLGTSQLELEDAGKSENGSKPTSPSAKKDKKGKKGKKSEEAAATAPDIVNSGGSVAVAASASAAGSPSGSAAGVAAAAGAAAGIAASGAASAASGAAPASAAAAAAATGAPAGGTAVADPVLEDDAASASVAAKARAAADFQKADQARQDFRSRHVENELAVAKLRWTNLNKTIETLEKQLANVKAGRDRDFGIDGGSDESGELEDAGSLLEGKVSREKGGVRKSKSAAFQQDGKSKSGTVEQDGKNAILKGGENKGSSSKEKDKAEKDKNYASTLERRGINVPKGEAPAELTTEDYEGAGDGETDGGDSAPTPRRLAISGPSTMSRTQRAKEMGLDLQQRRSKKSVHVQERRETSDTTRGGVMEDSRRSTARGTTWERTVPRAPELSSRGRSETRSVADSELEDLEPWRRIFPNDPPEVAKQKYEFCRAHKVVYAHLYIHKKQRRLKFKLVRLVKQQRRHLKLKTKLLMSFLSDDQKIAIQKEVGLHPDGDAKQEAHHKAELVRLNERLAMLAKLLAFWRRRMGAFEDEIDGKRRIFRGEIARALEHVTRMADYLRIEREYEREVLQERHREIEERRMAEMEKQEKLRKARAEKAEKQAYDQHGHHVGQHGRSAHIASHGFPPNAEHNQNQKHGNRLAHADNESDSKMDLGDLRIGQSMEALRKELHSSKLQDVRLKALQLGSTEAELKDVEHSHAALIDFVVTKAASSKEMFNSDHNGQSHGNLHRRDSAVGLESQNWKSHVQKDKVEETSLDEAIKVTKQSLKIQQTHHRSSIGGVPDNSNRRSVSQKLRKESVKRATLPEEDKALDFLHTLMHRLSSVNEAVNTTMHVGETAMSDTLLAPKVNGQALLKYYIGLILHQPTKQREIVFNHLIGLERQRLIILVRHSFANPVRHAIEACNQVIKVLEMTPEDLEQYVHENDNEKEPTPSESSDTDSSAFFSDSSGDDVAVKDQLIKRKKSREFWKQKKTSFAEKALDEMNSAGKRMSTTASEPLLRSSLRKGAVTKGVLKKGSTIQHIKQEQPGDLDNIVAGQDHELETPKARHSAKMDARPLTHARTSVTLGGPGEDLAITGEVKGLTAKRGSIQTSQTVPDVDLHPDDKEQKDSQSRQSAFKNKSRKRVSIAFGPDMVSIMGEDEDKSGGASDERVSKVEPDDDSSSLGSSSSDLASDGPASDERAADGRPAADARQAGKPIDRRRTDTAPRRRNSTGNVTSLGSPDSKRGNSMAVPAGASFAGLHRRRSLEIIQKQDMNKLDEHRKNTEALLQRRSVARRASTDNVTEMARRASFDGRLIADRKHGTVGAGELMKQGIAKILSHEADVEPMGHANSGMEKFEAAMGEEWLQEAKAARRASLQEGATDQKFFRYHTAHVELLKQNTLLLGDGKMGDTDAERKKEKKRERKLRKMKTTGALQSSQPSELEVPDFLLESEKSRGARQTTPVPEAFRTERRHTHFAEDGRHHEVHFQVEDPPDQLVSQRRASKTQADDDLENVGHDVAEQLDLFKNSAASKKRRQSIIGMDGDMEHMMQGVLEGVHKRFTAERSSRVSMLIHAGDRRSVLGDGFEGSDDEDSEDEEEKKATSMTTVLAAARFKSVFKKRRKSFRPQDMTSILKERSKLIEANAKFNKWLKRKGNLENELKKQLAPMNGRPRSAPARLVHQHRGHRSTRIPDNNVDFLATAFLARQLWHHRLSILPAWTEELDAEWQAIKDAVRQTKHLRLNEQQQRVAEMLNEMDSSSGTSDSDQSEEEKRKTILLRASKVERSTLQKVSEAVNTGMSEQVRKELQRQMRKEIQKKTRTLSSEETSYKQGHTRRMKQRRALALKETTEVGTSEHRAAMFKLDEELFAMMEQMTDKVEDETEELAHKRLQTKAMQRHIKASQRNLRKKTVIGNPSELKQAAMVDMQRRRSHKRDASGANPPRWNRWVTPKASSPGTQETMGFGDLPAAPAASDKQRQKSREAVRRKLVKRSETKAIVKAPEGKRTSKAERDFLEKRRKSVMFSKPDGQVDAVEDLLSESSPNDTVGSDEGHGKDADAEDGVLSNSDESSGDESWDGNAPDDDDLLARAPRKDHRTGFVMQSQYLERIQTTEIAIRPLLKEDGNILERRLGVPLTVIIQTALVQDVECESILLNMSASDFLSAMERMLLELEKRYINGEEEEGDPRPNSAEHSPDAGQEASPVGKGYAPPVDRRRLASQKKKRRSQRRSQHNQLFLGRRSEGLVRQKRHYYPSRAGNLLKKPARRMSKEVDPAEFPLDDMFLDMARRRQSLESSKSAMSTQSVATSRSDISEIVVPRQLPKQTVSATEFRHVVGRTQEWLVREAERRRRPEMRKSAHPAQGWLSRLPPTVPEDQEPQPVREEKVQQLRGALHRNVERAFRRHVRLWKNWRAEGGLLSREVDISEGILPDGWVAYTDEHGTEYYHNISTNTTQWEHPGRMPAARLGGYASSEDQEMPVVSEQAAENHILQRHSDAASGLTSSQSEEWEDALSRQTTLKKSPTPPQDEAQAASPAPPMEASGETSEISRTAEASSPDASKQKASHGVGSSGGPPGDGVASTGGDVLPEPNAADLDATSPRALVIDTPRSGPKRHASFGSVTSEIQPSDKSPSQRGTLRRLPSMAIRPSVAPVMSSDEIFDVSNSKRLGHLEALEAQPLPPKRTASIENLQSHFKPRTSVNATLGISPTAAAAASQAAKRFSGAGQDGSDARLQMPVAPVTALAASTPPAAAGGEPKLLQGTSRARGTRPSTTVSSESPRKSAVNVPVKKAKKSKEPTRMEEYFENFDECDLDVLLHDFSRPGTRLSRPGTRMSSDRNSPTRSRPGTRTEWERMLVGHSPGGRISREDAAPVSADSDPKLTGWQDYNWPSARGSLQMQKSANVSDQATALPSLGSAADTPTSPAVQHSMVNSSASTQDSWKASRDGPRFSARGFPKPPATAPGAESAAQHERTPRLPETSAPHTAPGQSRRGLTAETQKVETSFQKETPRSSPSSRSSEHALAALCHGLEKQVHSASQRNSTGMKFSDDLSADMAAAAAYQNTVQSSAAWTPRGSGHGSRASSGSGKASARGSRLSRG